VPAFFLSSPSEFPKKVGKSVAESSFPSFLPPSFLSLEEKVGGSKLLLSRPLSLLYIGIGAFSFPPFLFFFLFLLEVVERGFPIFFLFFRRPGAAVHAAG